MQVVHYCVAGSKPWRFDPSKPHMDLPVVEQLVRKWHDIYETETRPSVSFALPDRPFLSRPTYNAVGGLRVVS